MLKLYDATAFSPLGIVIWLAVYRDDAADHSELIEDARNRARSGFTIVDKHLQNRSWLVGERFSAADIMMAFTLMAGKLLGLIEHGSRLDTYVTRLQSRPAFKVAFDKTGGL